MKHVLIVWELGGNLGHLVRLEVTARVLAAQNMRVTFAVRDFAKASPWLVARGWPCMPAPYTVSAARENRDAVNHDDWLLCDGFDQPQEVLQLVRNWAVLIEKIKVDAMVLDFAPSAAYVAHYFQIPYVVSSTGFCVPPYFDRAACFHPWRVDTLQQAQEARFKLDEALKILQSHLGPRAAGSLQTLYPNDVVRYCTFAQLDHFADRTGNIVYGGVIWNDIIQSRKITWGLSAAHKIFCYLNGTEQQVIGILQVMKKSACNVIAIAPHVPLPVLQYLTCQDFQCLQQPINLNEILPEADLVVTHGGVGLVGQSLCAGVPSLMLPLQAEQALLAQRVAQHSFGVGTFRVSDHGVLKKKLEAVLNDGTIRSAVKRFSSEHIPHTPEQAAMWSIAQLNIKTVSSGNT